jgi:predicted nucleic acid-binding protein
MNKILLDSDVIINILKKREETVKKLLSFENYELFISPIVVAEIYAGARAKEIKQIEELFSYFVCLDINKEIGKIAGEYANQFRKAFNKISLEDYIIAGTAKYYNLKLWTYNKKHYPMKDIILI